MQISFQIEVKVSGKFKNYILISVFLLSGCSTVKPWHLDDDLTLVGNFDRDIKVSSLGGIHEGSSDTVMMPAGVGYAFVPTGPVKTFSDAIVKSYSKSLAVKLAKARVFKSVLYADEGNAGKNELNLFFIETYRGPSGDSVKLTVDITLRIDGNVVVNKLLTASSSILDGFSCLDCNMYQLAAHKLDVKIFSEIQKWLNSQDGNA